MLPSFMFYVWQVAIIISFDDWQPSIRPITFKDSYHHLYHTSLAKPNCAQKCVKFHLFPMTMTMQY